jgi:hypothetical protein
MNDSDASADGASRVISSARAAEQAIQHLCRTTLSRPSMTPTEVDVVLSNLADAAAALPQAARQLGDILTQAKEDHVLKMDSLTETADPNLAIDTARRLLDGVREPALSLHRLLDAAHNETAHIAVTDRLVEHPEEDPPSATSPDPGQRTGSPRRWVATEPDRVFDGDVKRVVDGTLPRLPLRATSHRRHEL